MGSIDKIVLIDRGKLNEEFYFESLIEEASRMKMLSDNDIEKIQFQCLELLSHKTQQYNSGDSSSIPVEAAKSIMKSNLYTISIWLKSFLNPDDAVKALKEMNITDIYTSGRKCIDNKIKSAKHLHNLVIKSILDTDNYTYNSTVIEGIKGFFKVYNPDYEANEIHITADYPLCNPIENLAGIEFIQRYLESIYYENMFCGNFSRDAIQHLLLGYDEKYSDLIFNIFEIVLTTAIGCKILGINAAGLNISEIQVKNLYDILSRKTKEEIGEMALIAYNDLIDELSITNLLQKQYIKNSLTTITSKIYLAVKMETLDKVVVIQRYPEQKSKLYFSLGDKMGNDKYRDIIKEVMQCSLLADKISIIKNEIHTLADLEDLMFDAELTADEIMAVLKILEPAEIAALAKRHPIKSDIDAIDLSEEERELSSCLHKYISLLPIEAQNWIYKTMELLEDEV